MSEQFSVPLRPEEQVRGHALTHYRPQPALNVFLLEKLSRALSIRL